MKRPPMSYIFVMIVPYVAALASISGPQVWGLHYTGFIWSFFLLVGVFLILQHQGFIPFPWRIWVPWFGYVLLSLTWGGIHWRHNLQDPLQIVTPLVVGIVASFSIKNEHQYAILIRRFTYCLLFITAVFLFFWYGPGTSIQKPGTGYSVRPSSMTLTLIGCLFVARMNLKNTFRGLMGWSVCLIVVVFSASRMATLVLLLLLCVSPLYRRISTRFAVVAAISAIAVFLFYSPIFQQSFFASGEGSMKQVLKGDFSGSGRFEVWPVVVEEAKKHIVFGVGVGEFGRFAERAHLKLSSPLNDYLKILFEFGVVGLCLFASAVLRQMYLLRKMMRFKESEKPSLIVAAYLGLFALLILSFTENTMIYGVYFMNPLFVILGAAYGIEATRQPKALGSTSRLRSNTSSGWNSNENVRPRLTEILEVDLPMEIRLPEALKKKWKSSMSQPRTPQQ